MQYLIIVIFSLTSVAQFLLSQTDVDSRSPNNGLCFIADKNFVVLGALFAFFVPMSVAIVFTILCQAEVHMVEKRLYCIGQQVNNTGHVSFVASSLPEYQPEVDRCDQMSDETPSVDTSGVNDDDDDDDDESSMPTNSAVDNSVCSFGQVDRLQSTVTLTSDVNSQVFRLDTVEGDVNSDDMTSSRLQQTTSFCDDDDDDDDVINKLGRHATISSNDHVTQCVLDDVNLDTCNLPQSPSVSVNYTATMKPVCSRQPMPLYDAEDNYYFDDDITGAKLLIRADVLDPISSMSTNNIVNTGTCTRTEPGAIADEGLRQELDLFRTTRCLVLSTMLLWLPMTVANVIYATCESCRAAMTVNEVMTIKWVAYMSPLLVAGACLWYSDTVRHAVWFSMTHCCRRQVNNSRRRRITARVG